MLNLAAVRYRHVLAAEGGPLERVDCGETSVAGERRFLANAFLCPGLRPVAPRRQVWGDADGSGTDVSPLVARHKAVSEAIERWALYASVRSGVGAEGGFDVDPSSNGMAAFPGWWARQARPGAHAEAIERYCLLRWWEGLIRAEERPAPWHGVTAVVIPSGLRLATVVLHRRSEPGLHAFGHAAGEDFGRVCAKAMIELERHESVVRHRALIRVGEAGRADAPDLHPIERRSLFFSTEEGHALFRERVRASAHATTAAPPRWVFDGPVRGPWERYASVWRVVSEPPSDRFLSADPHYFLW